MIKIWHFRESSWEIQILDIDEEFTLQMILDSLSLHKEPCMILGDKDSYVGIFESLNGSDKYVAQIEIQDLKKTVVISDFPSLLNFLDLMSGTMLGLSKMGEIFDDQD